MKSEALECFERGLFLFGAVLMALLVGIVIGMSYERNNKTYTDRTNVIDSLINVNDSIKIKVEKLDSIKDAKIIEVSTLNNDSTLKLFYKLVSE